MMNEAAHTLPPKPCVKNACWDRVSSRVAHTAVPIIILLLFRNACSTPYLPYSWYLPIRLPSTSMVPMKASNMLRYSIHRQVITHKSYKTGEQYIVLNLRAFLAPCTTIRHVYRCNRIMAISVATKGAKEIVRSTFDSE